jgi:hypothetical protein
MIASEMISVALEEDAMTSFPEISVPPRPLRHATLRLSARHLPLRNTHIRSLLR